MSRQLTLIPTKPTKRRRAVRKDYRQGDQVGFVTKSFTNDEETYHPAIDVKTGEWSCTCKAAQFNPHKPCKHTIRGAQNLVRSGDADPSLLKRLGLTCCHRCGETELLFGVVHDDGTPAHDVWICQGCIDSLRSKT